MSRSAPSDPGAGSSRPLILAIDAAGSGCAAAFAAGDRLVAIRHQAMMHGQAEALLPMVDEVVGEAGLAAADLELVAVTTGPGSFTGIRVGIAAARGIALVRGLPLIGISSFEAVAEAVADAELGGGLLVALESRRADLYIQLFDAARRALCEPAAALTETLAASLTRAGGHSLAIAGDGAPRALAALAERRDARVVEIAPPVVGAARAALRRWRRGERGGAVLPLYLRAPGVTLAGGQRAAGTP